jgi:hypothetical protein
MPLIPTHTSLPPCSRPSRTSPPGGPQVGPSLTAAARDGRTFARNRSGRDTRSRNDSVAGAPCRRGDPALLSAPPIPAGKRFSEGRDWAGIFGHGGPFHATETGIARVSFAMRGTAWWSWQDSNQQPSDYGDRKEPLRGTHRVRALIPASGAGAPTPPVDRTGGRRRPRVAVDRRQRP